MSVWPWRILFQELLALGAGLYQRAPGILSYDPRENFFSQ